MEEIYDEIKYRISELTVDCPDCEYFGGDDQFTCSVCWGQGGGGQINVLDWINENKEMFIIEDER